MPHWFYPAAIIAVPVIATAWLWFATARKPAPMTPKIAAAEPPARGED
jgi:hypothetical protein